MLPPRRQREGITCSRNSSPDAGPHIKERCSVIKTPFMMSQRMKYMLELVQPCVILHDDYSTTLVLNKGESIFTLHRVHHFPVRHIGGQPPLPLCLWLSSCWLFRRNNTMAESSLPFPGLLSTASRSTKSFLFISGSILTGRRWEAKMSTSILAAAGACGTLSFFFFLFPRLFCSHPVANVAWQEHAMNVNSTICSSNDSCTSHVDEKNSKHGLKM